MNLQSQAKSAASATRRGLHAVGPAKIQTFRSAHCMQIVHHLEIKYAAGSRADSARAIATEAHDGCE
jgi:hypothetical protein